MSDTNPQHDEVIRDIINEHHESINIDMVPGTLYSLISDELDTRGYDDTGFDDHPFIQHLNKAPEKRPFSSYHDIYHFSKSFIPDIREPSRLPIPTCDEKKKLFDYIDNGGLSEEEKDKHLARINELDKDLYEIMIEQKANNKVHENHDGFVYITNDDIKKFQEKKLKSTSNAPSSTINTGDISKDADSPSEGRDVDSPLLDASQTAGQNDVGDEVSGATKASPNNKASSAKSPSDKGGSAHQSSNKDLYGEKARAEQEKAIARDKSASYKQALQNPMTTGVMGVMGALGNFAALGLMKTSGSLQQAFQGQLSKHEKLAKRQRFLSNMVEVNNSHIKDIVAENNQIMNFIYSKSDSDSLDRAFIERSRTALHKMSENISEICEKKSKKRIPEAASNKVDEHLRTVDEFISHLDSSPLGDKLKDLSEALVAILSDIKNMVRSITRRSDESVERSP